MSLHLLYMFPSAWERVVGLEKRGTTADDFLPLIDSGFDQKVVLERNPGPEQIAALQPDLVIIKGLWVDALGETLAEVNIPSMYLALESPDQFYRDVRNLGAVLGEPERAEEIVAFYQHQLLRLEAAIGGVTAAEKPRVLLLDYGERGGNVAVQVPAQGWVQTIQVRAAGGIPVWLEAAEWTDGWTVVNLEQIALWNPDMIFMVGVYNLDANEVLGSIRADPRWNRLAAVQNNKVHLVPSDLYRWDTPGPRWILGMVWMASQTHPGRFAEWDMRQELYDFYGQLYGMHPAAVDEHIIPRVDLDGA